MSREWTPHCQEATDSHRQLQSSKKGQLLGDTLHDIKHVNVLSIVRGTGTVENVFCNRRAESGHRTVKKPQAIDSYNPVMNGVDMLDQRMAYYCYPHRQLKWYMVVEKVFRNRWLESGHRTVKKLQAIDNYDQAMNGVDMLDQRMAYIIDTLTGTWTGIWLFIASWRKRL